MKQIVSLIIAVLFATPLWGADVVFVGEMHDNPQHHQKQRDIVAGLQPAALVFEMLTPDQAGSISPTDLNDAEALAQRLNWAESGWPAFSFYHQIMTAAPKARIYGAQVPRDDIRQALETGVSDYFGEDAGRYGLDLPLPNAEQITREAAQQEAHCGMLPEDALPRMVDAQRLRDAELARAAFTALTDTGGPVVVITGNGHARRDWGAPHYLGQAMPKAVITAIGQGEGGTAPPGDFDALHNAPAPPRDDPCAAFKGN